MTLTRELALQPAQSALRFIDVQNFSAYRDGAEGSLGWQGHLTQLVIGGYCRQLITGALIRETGSA